MGLTNQNSLQYVPTVCSRIFIQLNSKETNFTGISCILTNGAGNALATLVQDSAGVLVLHLLGIPFLLSA